MIQTINLYQFREAFSTMGRIDKFSYAGLESLFDYLEDSYREGGEEYLLDVISLCCSYSEASYKDIARDYGIDIAGIAEEEASKVVIEWLHDNTSVVTSSKPSRILYCSDF